jgi:hypothetical protein
MGASKRDERVSPNRALAGVSRRHLKKEREKHESMQVRSGSLFWCLAQL